jgi:hypothetical protein
MSHDHWEQDPIERGQLSLPLAEEGRAEAHRSVLADYRESDDEPTSFRETPHPPPSWLVQVTPLDRRMMSRDALLDALHSTELVGGDTLVWRQGMTNWRTIAELEELGYRPSPARLRAGSASALLPSPMTAGLCGASALVALASTLYVLSAAGVFTSPRHAAEEATRHDRAHVGAEMLAASLGAAPRVVVSAIAPAPAPPNGGAREQVEQRHQQRAAQDRPEDREGFAVDVHRQQLRQVQVARKQHAKQRPEKANHDGDQKAAARAPTQRTANRAADPGDDQEQQ